MSRAESRKRYREIAGVLAHYGFEWLWADWGIGKILGDFERRHGRGEPEESAQPVRLRLALEELGTTFIKIGQMLSTRPDLIPHEYVVELSKLQDHAPAVSYEDVTAVIAGEFGESPETVYGSFDQSPRAAGSIAQVHSATLPDGTPVVVKVRRPGIENLVEQDLAILGQMARFLAHNTELGKKLDVEGIVDEFGHSLRNELDFAREGQNAERISDQFKDDPVLNVPDIYWDFSTHSVLTMEAIQGTKIDDIEALDAAGIDRKKLAEDCAHIALVQVLDHGFFHADPHPGNFFVQSDGVIALIDYGMVGRLGDHLRESLLRLAMAVTRRDSERLVDQLLAMGAMHHALDRQGLTRDVDQMLAQYDGQPLGEVSAAEVFRQIATISQKYWLQLPRDLVLLVRVVAMDEGMGAMLDPEFNLVEFAQPYFKRFWKKHHSVKEMGKRLKEGAIDMADLALDLPEHVMRLAGQLERGEVRLIARLEEHDAMMKHIERSANRIAVSVLTGGLVIALSILALAYRPDGSEGFAHFLLRGLLVVGVLAGGWLLLAFWKSTR